MTLTLNRVRLSFDYITVAFLCVAVIVCSDNKLILSMLFTVMHEAGHIIAMLCFGSQKVDITVNLFNVAICDRERSVRSYKRDIIVICAGPLVNITLFAMFFLVFRLSHNEQFYTCAMLNLVLGVFNLLPFESTDGGQLLYIFLCSILSVRVARLIITAVTVIMLIPISVLGFLLLFRSSYNYTLLFAALYLAVLIIMKKSKFFE